MTDSLDRVLQLARRIGWEHAADHRFLVERYGHGPLAKCPYIAGSAEEVAYQEGWDACMKATPP